MSDFFLCMSGNQEVPNVNGILSTKFKYDFVFIVFFNSVWILAFFFIDMGKGQIDLSENMHHCKFFWLIWKKYETEYVVSDVTFSVNNCSHYLTSYNQRLIECYAKTKWFFASSFLLLKEIITQFSFKVHKILFLPQLKM